MAVRGVQERMVRSEGKRTGLTWCKPLVALSASNNKVLAAVVSRKPMAHALSCQPRLVLRPVLCSSAAFDRLRSVPRLLRLSLRP